MPPQNPTLCLKAIAEPPLNTEHGNRGERTYAPNGKHGPVIFFFLFTHEANKQPFTEASPRTLLMRDPPSPFNSKQSIIPLKPYGRPSSPADPFTGPRVNKTDEQRPPDIHPWNVQHLPPRTMVSLEAMKYLKFER
jgi:hypothetical protein